jgi:hypothetical protein
MVTHAAPRETATPGGLRCSRESALAMPLSVHGRLAAEREPTVAPVRGADDAATRAGGGACLCLGSGVRRLAVR